MVLKCFGGGSAKSVRIRAPVGVHVTLGEGSFGGDTSDEIVQSKDGNDENNRGHYDTLKLSWNL